MALGLVPSLLGITWGVPTEARYAKVAGADRARISRAIVERTLEDEPRKAAGLTFAALDVDAADTEGRLYRRFALYSDHPDEMLVLSALARMRPRSLDFDPRAYHYGGLFIYPIGVAMRVAGWLGLATVTRDLDVYLEDPGRFGRMYVIGRLCVLAWHAAALAALWLLARHAFGARAAYLAVAIYALLPATVCFSHVMKPHAAGAAPTLFAALALARLRGRRSMLVAGGCVGAAVSMTPVFATAALLLPGRLWSEGEPRRRWKDLLAGVVVAGLVYAAFNPYAVLRPASVIAEMRYGRGFYRLGAGLLAPVAFMRYLPDALTWPGLLAAATGVAWLVRTRCAEAKALCPALACHFLVVSVFVAGSRTSVTAVHARFGFLIYPFLALFAAGMIDHAIRVRRGWGIAAAGALAASLLAGALPHVAAYAADARGGGTRAEAAAWIESNVPPGSTVGVRSRPSPWDVPPIELGRYRWSVMGLEGAARPDWILTAGEAAAPGGFRLAASFRPAGAGPLFCRPDAMSFASPAYTVWTRGEKER